MLHMHDAHTTAHFDAGMIAGSESGKQMQQSSYCFSIEKMWHTSATPMLATSNLAQIQWCNLLLSARQNMQDNSWLLAAWPTRQHSRSPAGLLTMWQSMNTIIGCSQPRKTCNTTVGYSPLGKNRNGAVGCFQCAKHATQQLAVLLWQKIQWCSQMLTMWQDMQNDSWLFLT